MDKMLHEIAQCLSSDLANKTPVDMNEIFPMVGNVPKRGCSAAKSFFESNGGFSNGAYVNGGFGPWSQSRELLAALVKYARNPIGMLVLLGRNGVGKTNAAMTIYNRNAQFELPLRDWDDAMFVTQDDLHRLAMEYHDRYGSNIGLAQQCESAKLFILDDFGTRPPTDALNSLLYTIFDRRWSKRLTHGTIVTTNLNSEQIGQQFGTALVSRMFSGDVMLFKDIDHRM